MPPAHYHEAALARLAAQTLPHEDAAEARTPLTAAELAGYGINAVGVYRIRLQVEDAFLPWDAVGRLAAVPARGRSDRLVVEAAGAPPLSVPLDYLTVMPATLDAGVRALSGGRCHVDFTALDL